MKLNEKQLKNMLVECYTYHFKKARSVQDPFEIGQHTGAANAYSTIMLMCFGGKETFDIWDMTRRWCDAEEDPDER